eukprot:2890476-Pyramimonas_sp.AAC.1
MGLARSIFQRLHDSLGEQDGASITLSPSYRTHPFLTFSSSAALYNKALLGGLPNPLADGPLVHFLPWALVKDHDPEQCRSLAELLKVRTKDLLGECSELHPDPKRITQEDAHRTLLVHNTSYELTSTLAE